jgi:hypothetical protein
MALHKIMCRNETTMIKKTNNLFKNSLLMHLNDVLYKMSVGEYIY